MVPAVCRLDDVCLWSKQKGPRAVTSPSSAHRDLRSRVSDPAGSLPHCSETRPISSRSDPTRTSQTLFATSGTGEKFPSHTALVAKSFSTSRCFCCSRARHFLLFVYNLGQRDIRTFGPTSQGPRKPARVPRGVGSLSGVPPFGSAGPLSISAMTSSLILETTGTGNGEHWSLPRASADNSSTVANVLDVCMNIFDILVPFL